MTKKIDLMCQKKFTTKHLKIIKNSCFFKVFKFFVQNFQVFQGLLQNFPNSRFFFPKMSNPGFSRYFKVSG